MAMLSDRTLLTAQVICGVVALSGMALYPPAHGRILLIPLGDRHAAAAPRLAFAAGATLLGRGPLPDSWVVVGERTRIVAQMRGWDMLLLAAPSAGCGDDSRAVPA